MANDEILLTSVNTLINYCKQNLKVITMATNPPSGDGHRNGMVKGRSQTQTPSGNYVKRDTETGRFMDVKSDKKPFKGVRKEK